VDDEREFVQTLSERLQMRAFGSAVVYDGEVALSVIDEDEPEVMVLDLKMPGVDLQKPVDLNDLLLVMEQALK
jgi:DNA-binding response OmpR family regulator